MAFGLYQSLVQTCLSIFALISLHIVAHSFVIVCMSSQRLLYLILTVCSTFNRWCSFCFFSIRFYSMQFSVAWYFLKYFRHVIFSPLCSSCDIFFYKTKKKKIRHFFFQCCIAIIALNKSQIKQKIIANNFRNSTICFVLNWCPFFCCFSNASFHM